VTTHATLSPSSRHRWGACPGSVREEAKYPSGDVSSPAAIDGTHSHTLLERCLKLDMSAKHLIGVEMQDHEGTFTVDDERAARVQVALDYIASRPGEPFSEHRVDPAFLVGRTDLAGTVDVRLVDQNAVELIDYKDGIGVVEAKCNPQLEQYALGVLADMEKFHRSVDTVTMTIVQPRNAVRGLPTISSHTVPASYILNDVRARIIEQARATDDPNAPLIPGDKQCRWCKAKGSCSALANNVMKEVGVMFQPVTVSTDIAQQATDKDPATMTGEQLQQILEAAPLMRQMIEAVEAEAQRRLEAGTPVPGFKLVNGRGSRAWTLPEEQMAEKLVKMGIPKGAVYETKMVSPAKVEKLTWEKRDGTKVSLSPRQLRTIDQEYVSKVVGKPTIAPESDSRPAVVTNAAPMFGAVTTAAPAAPTLPSWLS